MMYYIYKNVQASLHIIVQIPTLAIKIINYNGGESSDSSTPCLDHHR